MFEKVNVPVDKCEENFEILLAAARKSGEVSKEYIAAQSTVETYRRHCLDMLGKCASCELNMRHTSD